MDPKQFGARLRELREAAGLSQKELAEKAGLSLRGISHWEQGMREPLWSNVLALAKALGVSCLAFEQEPAEMPARKRGRPPKAEPPAEPEGKAEPKKARKGKGK